MITERIFDEIKGIGIAEITLHNAAGMEVSLLSYGATIRSVRIPTASGEKVDVCLGYDTIDEYVQNSGYFGASVGRVANRIGGAAFDLDGVHYTLAANTPPNHLHGGLRGWNTKIWDYSINRDKNSVTFSCRSADMEEGYPGEVRASAIFTLTEDNRMLIEYTAVTDKATPINLTNHWYFNLNGHSSGNVLGHELQLMSECITETDAGLIPNGNFVPVEGTAYDFREAKTIGRDFAQVEVLPTKGYDNNYVLGEPGVFKTFAILRGEKTGITMTGSTNMEGVQFYSGNSISDRKGKDNASYTKQSGMCFEPQHYPNAVNLPNFPTAILQPGKTYYHHTEFKFEG